MSEAIQCSSEAQQAHSEHIQTSFETLSSQAGAFGQSSSAAVGETTNTLGSLITEVRKSNKHMWLKFTDVFYLQHKRLTGEKEKTATELQATLDSGFDALKVTVSNHADDMDSKLEHFSATNTEMTDSWIKSSEVMLHTYSHVHNSAAGLLVNNLLI